jgi:hypothetical protein
MTKETVARLGVGYQFLVGCQNIGLGGRRMLAVIHERCDIFLLETVDFHNVALHIVSIVLTAAQDALFVASVVDTNHQSPARTTGFVSIGNQVKLCRNINGVTRCQLGGLGKSAFLQIGPHFFQDLHKAEIGTHFRFIRIQDL